MKQSKKWAEQCLVEDTFSHTDEKGNKVTDTLNCLYVCISGKELFRKEFIEGKYQGKNKLIMPYDFIVEAGDLCPDGNFYELEYTIGEHGLVYRALIQAVDPVTDLPLIIARLKQRNLLPSDFKALQAWLRPGIDAICIGHCSKDEEGEAVFYSGQKRAKDGIMDDGTRMTMREYAEKYIGLIFYYWRGDLREVTISKKDLDLEQEKIFICGENGDDPEFAERKDSDMERLSDLLDDVLDIINDYNLPHFMVIDRCRKNPGEKFMVSTNISHKEVLQGVVDAVYKYKEL